MSEEWRQAITGLELGILGIFTAEYVLRLWIAERPWKYALSFYGLIDLATILPFYLTWGTETTALRAVRLLRLIWLWKHRGYTRTWIRLGKALRENREEATIFLIASGLTLYIAAVGIHQFEADAQPKLAGFGDREVLSPARRICDERCFYTAMPNRRQACRALTVSSVRLM